MSELRKDPILDRWVIISTDKEEVDLSQFCLQEPETRRGGFCPFCYGNEDKTPPEISAIRDEGTRANTAGWQVRVVPNKFPALMIEGDLSPTGIGLFDMMNGIGAHEVIIENPSHDRGISDYTPEEAKRVIKVYRERKLDLKKDGRLEYILIFKNHGLKAGASLEHSHSQLIALPCVPIRVEEELAGARRHFEYKERCIFCDILRQEQDFEKRIILENEDFISFAPFVPRFPFETWILPKRHRCHFFEIEEKEENSLSEILPCTLNRLKKLLNDPPYNYIIHTSPLKQEEEEYYHWHLEIMPQLARVGGFEWGTGFFLNPVSPEQAARQLKEVG